MKVDLPPPIATRVTELISLYDEPGLSAAHLLCDRHPPDSLAYRIVSADLSAEDVTYGDLRLESERVAAALQRLGVRPGDRVATLMGKSRAFLVSLMGIWRLGAVHVPLFTAFGPQAIAIRLIGSNAQLVICDGDQAFKLQPGPDMPARRDWSVVVTGGSGQESFDAMVAGQEPGFPAATLGPDHPIIHIYTSGTTGKPKPVIVPTRALASFQAYAEFGLGLVQNDLYWCAADPGWAYGLYFGILGSFTTGVPSLLQVGKFSPEQSFHILAEFGVTNFAAAPTVYRSMRASGLTASEKVRLRCASSAGEPLTPEVNHWAPTALGVPVHDHFGQTEMGMLINNHHHPLLLRPLKPGSMGGAMPGWKATVLHSDDDEEVGPNEVGRLAIDLTESPLAWFGGYAGDLTGSAEKFAGGGRWYVTGDTGLRDDEGYFRFSARDDDLIIMAGYRIGPFDVESVITLHPRVRECAVIAVPDEIRGELLEAFVVVDDSIRPDDALTSEIQQLVKDRYAAHAYPRVIHYVTSLPKTPSGKIQRFLLKEQRLSRYCQSNGTLVAKPG